MQTLRMDSSLLHELLEVLRRRGTVWAPVERGHGLYSLEQLDDVSRARPEALRTVIPFKKLLLKPRFAMMDQRSEGKVEESPDNDRGPTIFFGAHACDIHALKILDMLYLTDFVDPYYKRNRDQLTVIGYGCWPDEKCFCQSLSTSTVDRGFDLFLTPLDGRHLVTVGTSRGDDIVRASQDLFQPATARDTRDYLDRLRKREEAFTLALDVTDLPYVLELKRDDPVWEQLGSKCLCCGSCSMVCPTCSCFNVYDVVQGDRSAQRVRVWDSCLYRDYAMVAGGHSFRAERADRVRNRYYHKQESFVREFGMPSCVGCGRCIENCPTGINVVEVFQYVRGEL
jgi:sulfhydrogenase subunit beta (sulfur reductase)